MMVDTERRVRAAEDRLTRLDGEGAGELVIRVVYDPPSEPGEQAAPEPDFLGTCPDGRRLRVVHPR